jgi:hypothetical protein
MSKLAKNKVLTQKQYEEKFLQIKIRSMPIVTSFNVPVRSGQLKESFQYNALSDTSFEIKTNMFYMPYTNEKWISPRWNGRQNPNERWFELNAEYIAKLLARHLGGRYVRTQ